MPLASPLHLDIFGRVTDVFLDDSAASDTLSEELGRYPNAAPDARATWTVRLGDIPAERPRAANPALHLEHAEGFVARYAMATTDFCFEGASLRTVGLTINTPASRLHRYAQRAVDMQFTSRERRAGMIFHELALVPAAALDPERVPVHASALLGADGTVTLFGGTGGVGKTSLCLELCLNAGFAFVADDIAVLSEDGHVFPNLAYPKVYGYNLAGSPQVQSAVFAERGFTDRAHWHLHRLRGPDKVRRRVAPDVLYGDYSRHGGPVGRYVLLAREYRQDLRFDPVSAEVAASLSIPVLEAELSTLLNHIRWHEFNRGLLEAPPLVRARDLAERWLATLTAALRGAECFVARIPAEMEHTAFKRTMLERLSSSD